MEKQYDFQNIDIKLYLALKAMVGPWEAMSGQEAAEGGFRYAPENDEELIAAQDALKEFELSHGPIPEWATGRNWDYSLVPGAQLCTRDGRRMGNAHVVSLGKGIAAGPVFIPSFICITDAGSKFEHTGAELVSLFTVGDWISDVSDVLRRFDRDGHFTPEPKE